MIEEISQGTGIMSQEIINASNGNPSALNENEFLASSSHI
jgi:hypothetical protein